MGEEIQGEFEHHVLLAALRLGERAFTSTIVLELEDRTDREVSASAVYVTLRRLESKGLLESDLRQDTEQGERRERRFVRVTARGVEALRSARSRFDRLWDGLDILAGEGS